MAGEVIRVLESAMEELAGSARRVAPASTAPMISIGMLGSASCSAPLWEINIELALALKFLPRLISG